VRGGEGTSGGGVSVGSEAALQIKRSVIARNSATNEGGGISMSEDVNLRLEDSTVRDNEAGGFGGGIHNFGGILNVVDSTISGNRAISDSSTGGGIRVGADGAATVRNSTISGNQAGFAGGGVAHESSGASLLNNTTVTRNVADGIGPVGGGIVRQAGNLAVTNSIVAANTAGMAPDCGGQVTASYSLFGEDAGCSIAFPTALVLDESARLKPLADHGGPTATHALRANSPARNSGNPATPLDGLGGRCEDRDQRNENRPKGPRCDMGAYEG
jgi:hypothetical protein